MLGRNDFYRFATSNAGVSSGVIRDFEKTYNYGVNPVILEERKLNVTGVDIFSRLMMDRIVFFGDEVTDDTANIVQAELLYLDSIDSKKPINMYINSPGGSVSAGLGIYDTMNYINSPVYTTCTAMSASMGALLLSSGEKGHRYALPHARIMIHQPSMYGVSGMASDVEISNIELQKLKTELSQILADNCGKDIETILADCDRDHWMNGHEAMEYGLIDEVMTKKSK